MYCTNATKRITQLPGKTTATDKYHTPNLTLHLTNFFLYKAISFFCEISKINHRPNSLDQAGIQQATCKKCLKLEDKVLASSALETPSRNAFGVKDSVQKDH